MRERKKKKKKKNSKKKKRCKKGVIRGKKSQNATVD